MRKINHLNLLHQLSHTLHKRQMRRVLVAVVLPISLVLEFNNKGMCDAVLLHLANVIDNEVEGWKDGVGTWIPSIELSLPPVTDFR